MDIQNKYKRGNLFNKHAGIKSSPIYLAYAILNEYMKYPSKHKTDKDILIYVFFNKIKKINPRISVKQMYYALFVLYSLGIIEYKRPYIKIKKV